MQPREGEAEKGRERERDREMSTCTHAYYTATNTSTIHAQHTMAMCRLYSRNRNLAKTLCTYTQAGRKSDQCWVPYQMHQQTQVRIRHSRGMWPQEMWLAICFDYLWPKLVEEDRLLLNRWTITKQKCAHYPPKPCPHTLHSVVSKKNRTIVITGQKLIRSGGVKWTVATEGCGVRMALKTGKLIQLHLSQLPRLLPTENSLTRLTRTYTYV